MGTNWKDDTPPPASARLPEIVLFRMTPAPHTPPPSAPPAELSSITLLATTAVPKAEIPPPSTPRLPDTWLPTTVRVSPGGAGERQGQRPAGHGRRGATAARPSAAGCPFCPL